MAEEKELYIKRNPGDPITAEDWNELQEKIKDDIAARTQKAIDGIEKVPGAEDTDKLEGKTLTELTEEIVQKALSKIPERTGYRKLFKKLKVNEEKVVEHSLKAPPLVDIYQLDHFEVVASEDDYRFTTLVNFFLYHSSESKIRFQEEGGTLKNIPIEPTDSNAYKIPFTEMLDDYNVEYTDESSLGDLETEFWKAFFANPNDRFDDEQYTHSPWFDRCCREGEPVKKLKKKREWDDIWFQMRPRKTVNYPYNPADGAPNAPEPTADPKEPMPAPTQIEVVHFDFNTLGLKLLREPVYSSYGEGESRWTPPTKELKVMLLLKV